MRLLFRETKRSLALLEDLANLTEEPDLALESPIAYFSCLLSTNLELSDPSVACLPPEPLDNSRMVEDLELDAS